ncbi:MAG TPA: hypothetical protein VKA39_12525, partial [Beijerinckiaceae bacterium]|nr:hypothetical protein [Beijerinckiaceae bacterium]
MNPQRFALVLARLQIGCGLGVVPIFGTARFVQGGAKLGAACLECRAALLRLLEGLRELGTASLGVGQALGHCAHPRQGLLDPGIEVRDPPLKSRALLLGRPLMFRPQGLLGRKSRLELGPMPPRGPELLPQGSLDRGGAGRLVARDAGGGGGERTGFLDAGLEGCHLTFEARLLRLRAGAGRLLDGGLHLRLGRAPAGRLKLGLELGLALFQGPQAAVLSLGFARVSLVRAGTAVEGGLKRGDLRREPGVLLAVRLLERLGPGLLGGEPGLELRHLLPRGKKGRLGGRVRRAFRGRAGGLRVVRGGHRLGGDGRGRFGILVGGAT